MIEGVGANFEEGAEAPASLLRFDRQSGNWRPVETTAAENAGAPFIWLEGSDGDTLVYGSVGKKLAWFKPDR